MRAYVGKLSELTKEDVPYQDRLLGASSPKECIPMHSIAYSSADSASSTPARVTHLEAERARLHGSEEQGARGFVQVPRALLRRCKKLSAGEWAVLVEVLDRGVSWGRYEPQQITQADFRTSSGLSKQAIAD